MTRTDQDTWDLASSVGATATMVAAARALASEGANPIINDPYAAPLVRAVGLDFFCRLVDGDVVPEAQDGGERDLQTETDSIAVRTRFFDDFFLNAARDGIRQSVILAAGLDARAYRLSWPPGSVVYEVDQPKVVEFKSTAMSNLGAGPTADRRTVDVPSARSPGPPVRQHHRAQRARKQAGHRIPWGFGPDHDRTRATVQRTVGQGRLRRRLVGTVFRRRAQ
jgi:O-methyltransferase involved in polyketide biosynthesis